MPNASVMNGNSGGSTSWKKWLKPCAVLTSEMILTSRRRAPAVISVMTLTLPLILAGRRGSVARVGVGGQASENTGLRGVGRGDGAAAPGAQLHQFPGEQCGNRQQHLARPLEQRERQRHVRPKAEERAERDIAALLHAERAGHHEGGASEGEGEALDDQH